jgi:hypothetical protein
VRADDRLKLVIEVLTFAGDKICRQEVYFGWDIE